MWLWQVSPRIQRGEIPKQKQKKHKIKAFSKNIDFAWEGHWFSMKKVSKTNENQHKIVVFSKNIDLVQVVIGFWYIVHWKSMPLSSEINVFAESLDFFFLLRGLSPLDSEAHWPGPHVLRSSSSWMSQIYHDRLHSHRQSILTALHSCIRSAPK